MMLKKLRYMDKSRSKLKTKTVIVEINMVEGKYELKIFMLYDINEKNMYLVCTVYKWLKEAKNNNDTVNSRGNGNYSIEDAKKIARLNKEFNNKSIMFCFCKKEYNIGSRDVRCVISYV